MARHSYAPPQGGRIEAVLDAASSATEQAQVLREYVRESLRAPGAQMIADCSELSAMGSAIVAVLMVASEHQAFDPSDHALVVPPPIQSSLDAWRIDTGWSTFASADEARHHLDSGGLR